MRGVPSNATIKEVNLHPRSIKNGKNPNPKSIKSDKTPNYVTVKALISEEDFFFKKVHEVYFVISNIGSIDTKVELILMDGESRPKKLTTLVQSEKTVIKTIQSGVIDEKSWWEARINAEESKYIVKGQIEKIPGRRLYFELAKISTGNEKIRFLILAGKSGSKEALDELKSIFTPHLSSWLSVKIPGLTESFNSQLKLMLSNNLADSLKVTLDLSENSFLELDETEVEFPELQKGQKITKTLTVTPKYAGKFDFKIKIKAVVNGLELEAEKVIPVEVTERTTTPQTPAAPATPLTPSPATPVTPSASYQAVTSFPAELTSVYEPIEELGRGGFARVFKAKRKRDGEIVAVKIPLSLDPVTGKSFLKEIENWTKLKHPNIVRVYDYNILPVPFFEMEYCESSLERVPTPMKAKEAALLVFNIAEGLKYAHSKGIIHRDLKPSNILLKSGIPKISDWGLSKVLGQSGTTTTSFTALYAAPEQFSRSKFGPTDERTDIWQLGVIFYQLVTGKLPFESEDPFELMFLIMNEEPAKPSELNNEAGEVEPIIMRMLAKEKDERYENVAELQQDLASYLGIEFRRELKRSRTMGDRRLVVYYLGNLLIMSVKMGNLSGAYKYASDFTMLTDGELRREFEALSEQFRLRLEERLEVPVELIEKTDILVHKAMVRVR